MECYQSLSKAQERNADHPHRPPAAALRTRDPQRSIKTHSVWRERFELSEFG